MEQQIVVHGYHSILQYEEAIKARDYLVIANGDESQVKQAHSILDGWMAGVLCPIQDSKILQS